MLAKTDTVHYSAIANAIRTKNEKTVEYLPSEMAQAILDLSTTDWTEFKHALVDQLNAQFDLELTYDSTTDEILAAISTIEDGAQVTTFFIDLLNSQLGLQLEYDAEETEIADTVENKVNEMKQGTIDFSLLQYYVRKISNDYVTNPSEDATPEFLNYTNDIDDYMQISTNALTDLYGGD